MSGGDGTDEVPEDVTGALELELEHEAVEEPDGGEGGGDGEGELTYECSEWSGESRRLLASLLVSADVVHAWQGTAVSVRARDEAVVDGLVDEVMATARPPLPAEGDRIVYEVGDWPVVLQTELAEALAAAGIPSEWDADGDLVVLEEDEERVEAVIDGLPEPGGSSVDAEDGLAVHELLDRLFVACDRLARRPGDRGAARDADEAGAELGRLSAPFGVEPLQWRALLAPVGRLRAALSGDGPPDDGDPARDLDGDGADGGEGADGDVATLASLVRDLLREFV